MDSKTRTATISSKSLYVLSWSLVAYTIAIVVWGAWVRISGSGDGCGDHWPLCHGQVVPSRAHTKTWIEFSHRLSTGIYGMLVLLQAFLVRRTFSRGFPARAWSVSTLLFTVTEALIGKQLVTMGLVNESVALARVVVMPLHLVNTALLVGSTVMTAEAIKYGHLPRAPLPPRVSQLIGILIAILILLLTTGAVAALGSHLAPSESIVAGFSKDLSSQSHLAVRLRILHPALALLGPLVLFVVLEKLREAAPSEVARCWLGRLMAALGIAVLVGVCTLLTLAPVWLKMTHLLVANILVVITTLCVFHTVRPSPT
jgi:cytochrome c oxidase assembly protein subunit 15